MTLSAKREYLEAIRERYKKSTKRGKGLILDEFCATTGLTRKHAIRFLGSSRTSEGPKPGPKRLYDDEFVKHLVILWKKMRFMCGRRMKAALPIWLPYYEAPGFTMELRSLFLKVSSSTIDRLLRPYRRQRKKGLSSTKPGSILKSMIPIQTLDSAIRCPGYIEADTVAHCGDSLCGEFINSLTMTDLFSGWTENRACWNKKGEVILDRIAEVRKSLPFPMRGFACDNGSEFLNSKLINYLQGKHPRKVRFTRRRPYKKNDAAHVEQKNDQTVRKLFGYRRFDRHDLVPLMNEIYSEAWNPLSNHFFPVMKLKTKIRVGAKIRKTYDEPKPPYQRLVESGELSEPQLRKLNAAHDKLNPFELKKQLDSLLEAFAQTANHLEIEELKEGEDAA